MTVLYGLHCPNIIWHNIQQSNKPYLYDTVTKEEEDLCCNLQNVHTFNEGDIGVSSMMVIIIKRFIKWHIFVLYIIPDSVVGTSVSLLQEELIKEKSM